MAEQGVSEFVSKQLSDIASQLGQMSSAVEGLRADLRDESSSSKTHRENITARIDNIAERMGKAEIAISATKLLIDKSVMPMVTANNERKLMISGALKFWGVIFAVAGGFSAVMWSKLLNAFMWFTGNGPS